VEIYPPTYGENLMLNFSKSKAAFLAGVSLMVGTVANAALPAEATTAMSSISTGISDATDAAWPLIGAALVAGVIIKLVKRFTNKV
jgi:hypothetical protein